MILADTVIECVTIRENLYKDGRLMPEAADCTRMSINELFMIQINWQLQSYTGWAYGDCWLYAAVYSML